MAGELVLVTGGSGYIGTECILQLLNQDYRVRTTLRSLRREAEVRDALKLGGAKNVDSVEFVAADLTRDEGWAEAVKGCTYVHHVASPFPAGVPKHEDDLIIPAREGTLRVLKAARAAGVKRVVLTSSFAAIGYSPDPSIYDRVLDEKDWTEISPGSRVAPYQKSKTLAERAAWKYIEEEGAPMELAVINPVGVVGPLYTRDVPTSLEIVLRLMNGSVPGCPQLSMGVVDVRDVADLHLRAMTNPKAKGERFLAVSGETMSIQEMSLALRRRLGDKARKAPTRLLPNFVLYLMGVFDPAVRLITPELGKPKKKTSNAKAREVLGWTPIDQVDSLVATAESLIKLGILKV